MDRTQLVTLDVLARELGMSLDNVRYRFKQLRRSNQLVEGEDFIRDDYVNETNFVYRVDAARFYLKAGFPSLVSRSGNAITIWSSHHPPGIGGSDARGKAEGALGGGSE
jgi:hypothetical protein